jgi:hypothetical protein
MQATLNILFSWNHNSLLTKLVKAVAYKFRSISLRVVCCTLIESSPFQDCWRDLPTVIILPNSLCQLLDEVNISTSGLID